ncbi:Uncharacterized protein C4orf37 [Cricetulus griseus]|uniref:Uncharacterized protein C4orf37 n=1 Tax=Cricetulus griseus TaxID=10029 RepID=G3IK08_CRIGR|nr:Uncharacterized protein C4orf37 [Cricetulus griseus]
MYDRAPRWLRRAEGGSTEEHVGPGSYQVLFPKQRATGGYAPFLSLSSRKSAYAVAEDTGKAVPGPAHYNVSEAQAHGYHLNDDDSILRRTPPASDNTIGPAYYKPQFAPDLAVCAEPLTLPNLALITGKKLPDPLDVVGNQSEVSWERTLQYENINIKKDKQHDRYAFVPRLYEEIILQEEKKVS